jgi:hypothetical protein
MAILLSQRVAATLTHGADVFEGLIGLRAGDLDINPDPNCGDFGAGFDMTFSRGQSRLPVPR